jgi:DNA processing protein
MTDLYSLSQLIKNHPQYILAKDEIHALYRGLGRIGQLGPQELLGQLHLHFPLLCRDIQFQYEKFQDHWEHLLRLKMIGIQFVCYGESLYPSGCYLMEDPPLILAYQGAPAWSGERTIAVVGSREPSAESLQWMETQFSLFCEKQRPCVVSGGARGVDQKAHGLALRKFCPTIVVLPSGLGNMYPSSLREWIEPVLAQGGCFVSEYSYDQRMHKHLFHHRNRLIAALGRGTLLIEAKRRSGTLITAAQSVQLGKPVWVVPGHPLDPHFGGSLDLLTEGAQLIRDAEDINMFFNSELMIEKI